MPGFRRSVRLLGAHAIGERPVIALEATVLNTKAIKERVDSQGVVTLVADYTHRRKQIHELLTRLDARG